MLKKFESGIVYWNNVMNLHICKCVMSVTVDDNKKTVHMMSVEYQLEILRCAQQFSSG